MLDDVFEFLAQELGDYIAHYFLDVPGAFVMWAVKGFSTKFKSELKHRRRNMIVGALFWFFLIALIILIVSK